jgi:hypothetical protein
MALVAISGPKKVSIFWPPPPPEIGPCYGFAPLKTTTYRTTKTTGTCTDEFYTVTGHCTLNSSSAVSMQYNM